MGLNSCCKSFFYYHGLQGERNEPMQFCPYCGRQLTDKEFVYLNKVMEQNKEMTISKLARLLKKSTKTIRRWEKAEKIKKAKRNHNGWRVYKHQDLMEIIEWLTRPKLKEK